MQLQMLVKWKGGHVNCGGEDSAKMFVGKRTSR